LGRHSQQAGLTPLCSSTKSGQLIDDIIKLIPYFDHVKTNLYDLDHLPETNQGNSRSEVSAWAQRVGYSPTRDIVFCLGAEVKKVFKRGGVKPIYINHPGRISGQAAKEKYVNTAFEKLNTYLQIKLTIAFNKLCAEKSKI
jgi:hypothetical protein